MGVNIDHDPRIVMTMDGGGTSISFSALQGGKALVRPFCRPSHGDDLDTCVNTIVQGFVDVRERLPVAPVAISGAFPGPADYRAGVIGDLPNLPAFRGGIPLGPMLEERFGLPVFLNNDGDLFAYGEAVAGLLPAMNRAFEAAGSRRRFRNLFGLTIGTGLGAGLATADGPYLGDNGAGMEIWSTRSAIHCGCIAEEGVALRALRRVYARTAGIPEDRAPEPIQIAAILDGTHTGDRAAACRAFTSLGEALGDCLADALCLTDSLVVIGGGISHAHRHFLDVAVGTINSHLRTLTGQSLRRLAATAYNLEDARQRDSFLSASTRHINVPGSQRTVSYRADKKIGIGVSVLGTSNAAAVGAYALALRSLGDT